MKKIFVTFALILYIVGVQFIGLSQVEAQSEGSVKEVYSYLCARCSKGGAEIYIDGKIVMDNRDNYCPRGGSHSWSFLFKTVYYFRDGQWVFDHKEY